MDHTILIVDDSQSSVPELRATLENQGYHVVTALRGEDALDMLRSSHIDLIITEIMLPGMDGFDLIGQIRETPAWISLPIVVVTVHSAPEDYARAFQAGANEYFVKPIDPHKLLGVVAAQIARRSMAAPVWAGGAAAPAIHKRSEKAEIITTFSLKGGVGTSTIAVNLAVAIKQLVPSARVGLIDLSLEAGLDALMLDIVPTSTIIDWAREDAVEATPYLLNQYFVPHRTGISLLAAPASPEDAEIVRPELVRRTLELAQQVFDYLVVDTAASFQETSLIALESATAIVLPLTPDMAALKTTVSTIRVLKAVRVEEDKLRVVLNEIVPRAGLTKEQIESSIRQDIFVIPHAGASFIEASNHGTPLTSIQPTPPAGRAIFDLARTVCEPDVVEPVQQAKGGAGFEGIRTVVDRLRPRRA